MSNLSLYEQKSIFRQNLTNVMLAGSFHMSCKMNNNLTQINSLLGKSLQIQQSINLGIKQLNVQMEQLIKIAKYQTMLMQKREFEEKAGKQLRETIFHLHNEILNTMKSESSSIEKYFNLLSIKSSMLVNNVGTEKVDNFTDKKTIQDCYDTITNEMPNLENQFNEDEKKLALQLLDIIEVDEEDEIHKLSNSNLQKKSKFMNEKREEVERLFKTFPGALFTVYMDFEERKSRVLQKDWKKKIPTRYHDWLGGRTDMHNFFQSRMSAGSGSDYEIWKWYLTEFSPRLYEITEQDDPDFMEDIDRNYLNNGSKDCYDIIPRPPNKSDANREVGSSVLKKGRSFWKSAVGLSQTYQEQFDKFHFSKQVQEDALKCKNYILKAFELEEKEINIKSSLLTDEKKMNALKENIRKEKEIITRLANQHTWMKPLFANRIDNNIDLSKNPTIQTETEVSSSISPEPNIQTQTVSATQETNTNSTVQEKIHESVSKEQKLFNIELVSYDSIARAAVAFRQLGIKYDPILKSALPVIFQENVPEEDALKIKAKLEEKDCTVNLIEKS